MTSGDLFETGSILVNIIIPFPTVPDFSVAKLVYTSFVPRVGNCVGVENCGIHHWDDNVSVKRNRAYLCT